MIAMNLGLIHIYIDALGHILYWLLVTLSLFLFYWAGHVALAYKANLARKVSLYGAFLGGGAALAFRQGAYDPRDWHTWVATLGCLVLPQLGVTVGRRNGAD